MPDELPHSRLYTFIDEAREFALYFLEGQRLIQDLALLQTLRRQGFAYFRDAVLSVQPMIALLKAGEHFGFYMDSDEPYFRLKIETGHHGATRCMLLPDELAEFPATMRGHVRLVKLFPQNRPPYESVLTIDSLPLREVVNRVLSESYQVNCAVMVSNASDQSLMLHQLPPLASDEEYDFSPRAARARREELRESLEETFARALLQPEDVESAFARLGFQLLANRIVQFQCGCSKQRFVENLSLLHARDRQQLFDPGRDRIEAVCEYCRSRYEITRADLRPGGRSVH